MFGQEPSSRPPTILWRKPWLASLSRRQSIFNKVIRGQFLMKCSPDGKRRRENLLLAAHWTTIARRVGHFSPALSKTFRLTFALDFGNDSPSAGFSFTGTEAISPSTPTGSSYDFVNTEWLCGEIVKDEITDCCTPISYTWRPPRQLSGNKRSPRFDCNK